MDKVKVIRYEQIEILDAEIFEKCKINDITQEEPHDFDRQREKSMIV